MEHKISVVLPAHNEQGAIERTVEGLFAHYDCEILEVIVVDDASTDETASVVHRMAERHPKLKLLRRIPPCGVGRALKDGFKEADSESHYILSMDSDFSENIEELRSMIDKIEQGYDGVIGSRFIPGSQLVGYPELKKTMNRLFHFLVRRLFRIKQNDLTNNLKLYRTEIFKSLPWESNDFSINAETGMLPILAGYQIAEVPVSWIERRPGMGKSKFAIFKHGLGYIRVILYAVEFLNTRGKQKSEAQPLREKTLVK